MTPPRIALLAVALTAAIAPAAHAQSSFPQYCMYPWDGSICTPTPQDVIDRVPQKCFYPTDFALCVPPNL
jgi:hypothetical protein